MSDEGRVDFGGEPEEDPFLSLGRAIAGQCPAGFEQARLDAEFAEGRVALQLSCTSAGGDETRLALDPDGQDSLQHLLERIRAAPDGNGGAAWRKCAVTLRKGGGFAMEVSD